MPKSLVQLTAEIVQSQTSAKQMTTEEVGSSAESVGSLGRRQVAKCMIQGYF